MGKERDKEAKLDAGSSFQFSFATFYSRSYELSEKGWRERERDWIRMREKVFKRERERGRETNLTWDRDSFS